MVILEWQETLNRVSLGLIINTFKPMYWDVSISMY